MLKNSKTKNTFFVAIDYFPAFITDSVIIKKASEYIPAIEKGLDAGEEDKIPGQLYATITSFFQI